MARPKGQHQYTRQNGNRQLAADFINYQYNCQRGQYTYYIGNGEDEIHLAIFPK
jgi:hypothetical protein